MSAGNCVLDHLPEESRNGILAEGESVELQAGSSLHVSGEGSPFVYFLAEGVATMTIRGASRRSGGILLVGKNSAIGADGILGGAPMETECVLLTGARGIRVTTGRLFDLCDGHLSRFASVTQSIQNHLMMTQRTASCNVTHTVEQRLSQWLLMFSDLSDSLSVPILQDHVAELLMVHRPTISIASSRLRSQGLITQGKGSIWIANRSLLKKHSCECYAAWCKLNLLIGEGMADRAKLLPAESTVHEAEADL